MESNAKNSDQQLPIYFFSFLGLSCVACCALFSLVIGIGWLTTSADFVFHFGWENILPIFLIVWGLLPIVGYYLYQKRKK